MYRRKMRQKSGCVIVLVCLLVAAVAQQRSRACECTKQKYETYNYWDEPSGEDEQRAIQLQGSTLGLNFFSLTNHLQYAFFTRFYECSDGRGEFITTTVMKRTLAKERNSTRLLLVQEPGKKVCFDDPALFKFDGSNILGMLRSSSGDSALSLNAARNGLIFAKEGANWLAMPSINERFADPEAITAFRTTVTTTLTGARGIEKVIYVDGSPGLSVRELMPGDEAFSFRLQVFGFCKRPDRRGRIIQGRAVLLSLPSAPNQGSSEGVFLQVQVTDEGEPAPAPRGRDGNVTFPTEYSMAEIEVDDSRESRERYSRLLRPNTEDEHTVDKRYFEVLPQRDGTYRLATVINPNLFLAVISVGNRYELAVLAYDSSLPTTMASYDFTIDIPDVEFTPCAQPPLPNYNPPWHYHHHRRFGHRRPHGRYHWH